MPFLWFQPGGAGAGPKTPLPARTSRGRLPAQGWTGLINGCSDPPRPFDFHWARARVEGGTVAPPSIENSLIGTRPTVVCSFPVRVCAIG